MTDVTDTPQLSESEAHQPMTHFKTFAESTAEDWAIIAPQLANTQALVADKVIEQMRYLKHDHGGFPVDRLEHSLQTATRAERDGRDDDYIVCALLHDIGDNFAPYNHPDIAAAIVKTRVSEANHWMVQHHGIFQGEYFWHHIGLDPDTHLQFIDSPYYDYTREFCAKYDQTAFDSDYKSNPLEHYEPLLQDFFAPK